MFLITSFICITRVIVVRTCTWPSAVPLFRNEALRVLIISIYRAVNDELIKFYVSILVLFQLIFQERV